MIDAATARAITPEQVEVINDRLDHLYLDGLDEQVRPPSHVDGQPLKVVNIGSWATDRAMAWLGLGPDGFEDPETRNAEIDKLWRHRVGGVFTRLAAIEYGQGRPKEGKKYFDEAGEFGYTSDDAVDATRSLIVSGGKFADQAAHELRDYAGNQNGTRKLGILLDLFEDTQDTDLVPSLLHSLGSDPYYKTVLMYLVKNATDADDWLDVAVQGVDGSDAVEAVSSEFAIKRAQASGFLNIGGKRAEGKYKKGSYLVAWNSDRQAFGPVYPCVESYSDTSESQFGRAIDEQSSVLRGKALAGDISAIYKMIDQKFGQESEWTDREILRSLYRIGGFREAIGLIDNIGQPSRLRHIFDFLHYAGLYGATAIRLTVDSDRVGRIMELPIEELKLRRSVMRLKQVEESLAEPTTDERLVNMVTGLLEPGFIDFETAKYAHSRASMITDDALRKKMIVAIRAKSDELRA